MAKSFHTLPQRSQFLIFVLLSAVTAFAAWQVLIGPERAELATRSSRLVELQGDVARAKATASRLPIVQREVADLEASLKATTSILPDEKDPQDVLRNLHELASESAISLANFTPKAIATKTQYDEWPIEIGLEGGFHDLGRFFDRVANMPRLMSISELHIKTRVKPDGRGSVTATCVATTFVFKKEMAPPVAAPGGKKS